MIGPVPSRQAAEQFLSALQAELSGLGVSCDLRDDGGQLRLGVFFDDEAGGDLFDNVAVARFHGAWWYCWPQMTPICAVGSVTGAAQAILGELDVRDEDDVADVADLNVFRVLRLARLSDPPGPQPADSAQTHPLTPEGTRTADRCTGPAVAVYWDFENLHAGLLDEAGGPGAYRAAWHGPQEPIADIGAVAEYAATIGRLVVHRAYGNWQFFARYRDEFAAHAADLIQLFPLTGSGNGDGIRLALDVVGDLRHHPDVTHVIVVASSRDYSSLAQRCRRLGRVYLGIGLTTIGGVYELACNEFRLYHELVRAARSPGQVQPADGGDQ